MSSSSSSKPRTHFALFHKYRCGTSSRAGQPCSGVSHSPPHLSAMRLSGRSRSASGRFVVNPCSATTRQNLAAALSPARWRSEEHTSELQSRRDLVCRLLLEKKKKKKISKNYYNNKNKKTVKIK